MTTPVCLLAALVAMALYSAASVAQAAATRRITGPRVMAHPLYVAGMAADGLAWAASLVAMTRLPLVVVQPVLAGSVAGAVLLAVPVLGVRLSRRDVVGVVVTTAGLVLVSLASGPESTADVPRWFAAAMGVGVLVCAAGTAWWYSHGRPFAIAAVAGLSFAGAALAGRAVAGDADVSSWSGVVALLTSVTAWSVLAFGVLGTVAYARALERGGLGLATAIMWVVEAVLPAAVGVAVLGDTVRAGWQAGAVVGMALAVAGCVVLAMSPAQEALAA